MTEIPLRQKDFNGGYYTPDGNFYESHQDEIKKREEYLGDKEEGKKLIGKIGNGVLIGSLLYIGARTVLHNYGFGDEILSMDALRDNGPNGLISTLDSLSQGLAPIGLTLKVAELASHLALVRPARKNLASAQERLEGLI